jgi:tetratricopeptide (TPR) repeat protein
MPQSKSPSVVTLRLGAGMRWLLLLPALLAILGATFAVRWYVGNTVAEYSPDVTESGLEMARMAVRWAPGDPLTHWRLGTVEEKTFKPETLAAAVREYQEAVANSPNDYRYWMELGRALEAAGDGESGEKALRRAVELAPAYSHPRWSLGNLLLRAGKFEEAFNHLGRAAESDDQMRPQVFDLAMRVLDGDVEQVAKVTCASPAARLQFAIYLVGAQRFAEAMRMWGGISPADRRAAPALTDEMEQSLVRAKQFRALLSVMRESRANPDLPPAEQIWNGGFEGPLTPASADIFGWVINPRQLAQITLDSHGHTGQGSLRIAFRASSTLDKIPASQTVPVEPGTQYRLEYYLRTENLVTASTPVLTVSDALDGTVLTTSKPLPTGTNDWQQVILDFTTNPKHDGITVGFNRAPCSEADICPIFGSVWYDDFNLQRIGGAGSPRRDAGRIKR